MQTNGLEVKIKGQMICLKIRETLTRIGVASRKERKIYQSCHILHKQGRYFIVHFKELFGFLMVKQQIFLLTILKEEIRLHNFYVIGV